MDKSKNELLMEEYAKEQAEKAIEILRRKERDIARRKAKRQQRHLWSKVETED